MEPASRNFPKNYVNCFSKCIERDARTAFKEKQEWKTTKNEGCRLFGPACGGSYAVFDQRPLSPEMQSYCFQNLIHMPSLPVFYVEKLCDALWRRIEKGTGEQIKLSQSQEYIGHGRHKALGSREWLYKRLSAKEK